MPKRQIPSLRESRAPIAPALFDVSKLAEVFYIVRERWILGLALGVLAAGLFVFWKLQEPPTFRAYGIISVKLEAAQVIDIDTVEQTTLRGPLEAELNQHLRQLGSQPLLERVAASLSRADSEALIADYRQPREPPPSALGILGGGLDLRYLTNSRMLEIGFIHRRPEIAALVVNRIMEEYPRYLLERAGMSHRSAMAYLEDQATTLQRQVEASETALQAYRQRHQLVSLEETQNIIVARLKSLDQALTDARVRLSAVTSQTQQIAAQEAAGRDLAELAFIARSGPLPSILEQIKQLEVQREVLAERYLRRHPRMLENTRALEAVRAQKAAVITQTVTEIRNHEAQISREIENLSTELGKAENEALALDERGIEFNVLRQRLANDRQSYQRVLQRLNETQITRDLSLSNLEIVDAARTPWKPFAPSRGDIFLQAGLLFAVAFFGLPIGLHYANDKVRRFSDVETFLRTELLGDLPQIKTRKGVAPSPDRIEDEALRACCAALTSRLEMVGGDYRPKTFLLTSSIPREGKTTVTHLLGLTLAETGARVLLVDFDWRRPSLGGLCGVRNDKGLLAWLKTGEKVPETVRAARQNETLGLHAVAPGCDLLPAGGHETAPQALLNRTSVPELLRLLKTDYDYLLLDTPPVGVFPDAYTIARWADETLFVCRQNAISHRRAKHLLDRLSETPATLLGVILNGVQGAGPDGFRGTYGYGTDYAYKAYRSYYGKETAATRTAGTGKS